VQILNNEQMITLLIILKIKHRGSKHGGVLYGSKNGSGGW
jgi:hypothetical protein